MADIQKKKYIHGVFDSAKSISSLMSLYNRLLITALCSMRWIRSIDTCKLLQKYSGCKHKNCIKNHKTDQTLD